jgi:sigma-E factor negative regulatory protein RseA
MSEQQRQHISLLVDGEIDPSLMYATISALEANPELSAAWERYHLIGSALRGEGVTPRYREIAAAVRAQLESEPPSIAPARVRARRGSRAGAFLGAALAASAAFFAVFAVPGLFSPQRGAVAPPEAVAVAVPPRQFQLADPGPRWRLDQPGLESKLDRFLVNHQAYAPSSSIKGFLPYATVVGYEAGR